MSFSDLPRGAKIALGGCVAVAVGAALPWATVDTLYSGGTYSGFDGDGVLTFLAGVVVVALVVFRGWDNGAMLASAAAGVLSFLAAMNIYDSVSSVSGISETASVGVGIYVTFFGAVLLVAGPLDTYRSRGGVQSTAARHSSRSGQTQQRGHGTNRREHNRPRESNQAGQRSTHGDGQRHIRGTDQRRSSGSGQTDRGSGQPP
jgi:hypothetical protein